MCSHKIQPVVIAAAALLTAASARGAVSTATVTYSTTGSAGNFSTAAPAGFTTTGVSGLGIIFYAGDGVLELNATTISGSGTLDILVNATGFTGSTNSLNEAISATFFAGSGTVNMASYLDTNNGAYSASAPTASPSITSISGSWIGASNVEGSNGGLGTLTPTSSPGTGTLASSTTNPYSLTELITLDFTTANSKVQLTTQAYATESPTTPEPTPLALLALAATGSLLLKRRPVRPNLASRRP